MLTKQELAKYLKYGWVSDYNYPEPKKKTKTDYRSLVDELEEKCKDSILQTYELADNPVYLLSGGVDSSIVASQVKDIKTLAITNWNWKDESWALKVADTFSTTHQGFETQNEFYEEDLRKIQTHFDKPYSLLLGFFWFLTAKTLTELGHYTFIDGNGPDHSMMEDAGNLIIERATLIGQYEPTVAQKYLVNSFIKDISPSSKVMLKLLMQEHTIDKYIDALPFNQFVIVFDDDEVSNFGLEPFKLELREESIDHIDELLFHVKEESANLFYDMVEQTLGCESYHPLRRQDILDTCMETPYEIKNALGFQKLPFREICKRWVNYEIAARLKTNWVPNVPSRDNWLVGDHDFNYPIKLDTFKQLIDEYLKKKDNKIYNYLDYDLVVPCYDSQPPGITKFSRQIWNLLNLSIWMECHDD
jgi:hypothetical protein